MSSLAATCEIADATRTTSPPRFSESTPRVIDEDLAHRRRRDREVVAATLERALAQLQPGFVDEPGRVEGVTAAAFELTSCEAAQHGIDIGVERFGHSRPILESADHARSGNE
jgi:hypothetical protein